MPFNLEHITAPAIYARTSSEEAAAGADLEEQVALCRSLTAGRWAIPPGRIYRDDGASPDRHGLARLCQAVAAGEIDCVLVARLDRLSGSIAETVALLTGDLAGVILWAVEQGFHTASPPGPLILSVLAAFARCGREAADQRAEAGRRRRFAAGQRAVGDPPFGYRRGACTGTIVVDRDRAEIVRRIFQLYLQGYGFARIAGLLNAGGCWTGHGNRWTEKTVRDVAVNQVYAGKVKYGGRYGPGQHQPIIDEATFAAVQAARHTRERVGGRPLGSPSLLAGLVRCKGCGQFFHTQPASESKRYRKDGRLYLTRNPAYYVCAGRLKKGAAFCRCGQIQKSALDARVVERLRARFGPQPPAEAAESDWHRRAAEQVGQWEALSDAVRKQLLRDLIDQILVWRQSQGPGRFKTASEMEVDIVWK